MPPSQHADKDVKLRPRAAQLQRILITFSHEPHIINTSKIEQATSHTDCIRVNAARKDASCILKAARIMLLD
jgi:hypothetical protein